ncbi:MAG: hypothetical protein IPJ77_12965 [Planctomycetes bacterium]|nr:hypothetical protein [Planctomycetota bacterium]
MPSVEDGSTQPTVASAWRLCLSEDWWSCSFLSVYRSDHDYASYAQQEDFRVTEDGWASFASCE